MKQLGGLRKAQAGETLTRFVKLPTRHTTSRSVVAPMPAEATGTRFKSRVLPVASMSSVLVSGHSNVKIGRDVRKGSLFRNYWIYSLSLEERATCPSNCHHWKECYGNAMPFAKRVDHRDVEALQAAIERDIVRLLAVKGRAGILVRLHALGDFFSVEYVEFWGDILAKYPNLACYGYTARGLGDPIGAAISEIKTAYGRRFAVRWSDGGAPSDCTVSVHAGDARPKNAFMCPEQNGGTQACATCGLCWQTDKNVAFVAH